MAHPPTPRKKTVTVSGRRIVLFIAASVLFFILLSSVINLMKKYRDIRQKLSELQSEQATVAAKQAVLTQQNEFLTTPEGEERILRDKYDVVRPGEGVIIVTEPDDASQENSADHGSWIGNVLRSILRGLGIDKSQD